MLDISDFSREFYYTTNLRTGSHETQDSGLRSDGDNGYQCATASTDAGRHPDEIGVRALCVPEGMSTEEERKVDSSPDSNLFGYPR
jgi:hypothetical protein